MVIILMGVSGSGKSAVGRLLAQQLGYAFCDGDDHHPFSNVEKMSRGVPLTESDRLSWLRSLAGLIRGWVQEDHPTVLACSALTRSSRRILRAERGAAIRFVYLRGTAELIGTRLRHRGGHYMPASLLASQFATLEEPSDALSVDITASVADVAAEIRRQLGG